jgi:putative PIN family toxin of toxin-antitoxin system
MKIVLDTDVVVAGLRSPTGASAEIIRMARHDKFKPLVSVALILEYEAVATRAEHRLATGLSEMEILSVIDMLVDKGIWVRIDFLYRPVVRDPADEFVAETVLNGGGDILVTFNTRDFLALTRNFNVAVLTPRDALRRLRDGQ